MDACDLTALRDTTARFPQGCIVRRKAGAPARQTTVLPRAVVDSVVKTGIHGNVFLKTDDFMPRYLDPEWYEIVEG